MEKTETLMLNDGSSVPYHVRLVEPSECPLCQRRIKPEKLSAHLYRDENNCFYAASTYLCHGCFQAFISLSKFTSKQTNGVYSSSLLYVGPSRFSPATFDASIEVLSPQFVKIYNQALEAELNGLDELAGIGYRKSLEFLVKDYCIHFHGDQTDSIKAMSLSSCINNYIDDIRIKTLALKTTWIGNDETHYTRKLEGRDITDMKNFIKALVYFVGMVLIAEDAESIEHG